MKLKLLSVTFLVVCVYSLDDWVSFYRSRSAICDEEMVCNGDMCAEICVAGSVQVDKWSDYALRTQRWLQMNDSMLYYEFPGTHNSHISVAYGFGIERDFVSALHEGGELYWGGGDLNLGEGVDQYLSITDQLNIGIRHIEIDINWGPWVTVGTVEGIVVCHTPVVDPDIPAQIDLWAKQRGITNLKYDPFRLSCQGTYVNFTDSMKEIKKWLDNNVNDFVIVYFDTKWDISAEQAQWGTDQLYNIFGDSIFTPADKKELFNDAWPSLSDLIYGHGKRLLFENQKNGWTLVNGTYVVFTPTIWNPFQYGPEDLQVFPKCLIDNNFTYGSYFSRALDDTVPDSNNIQRQYRPIIDTATRCGSNIVSPHMINPDEMYRYVWSFGPGEPNENYDCITMKPSGRWATKNCDMQYPIACVSISNQTNWFITTEVVSWNEARPNAQNICTKSGYIFGVPKNGYQNALLQTQALSQYVWLNLNTNEIP